MRMAFGFVRYLANTAVKSGARTAQSVKTDAAKMRSTRICRRNPSRTKHRTQRSRRQSVREKSMFS